MEVFFAILGLYEFFYKNNAISFKNHNFCWFGGGRSKKISRCRGILAGGWLGGILAWCEGVMESWNPYPIPCCQRRKNEVFLMNLQIINYTFAVSHFPFSKRALAFTQYKTFTFFALCYKLAKNQQNFAKEIFLCFSSFLTKLLAASRQET